MTITLTCAYCEKRETFTMSQVWKGWLQVAALDSALQQRVCSLSCMASWAMRRWLEQERASEAK